MTFCKNFTMVAWTRPGAADNVLFTRLRCKQWSCEYCAPKNQAMWRAFLYERLPQIATAWWSLTVTAHSKKRGLEQSYRNLQSGIDRLMKRINRVFEGIEYVRVFEKHPTSDALHAHFVISSLTPYVAVRRNKNNTLSFSPASQRPDKKGFWTISTFIKKACHGAGVGYQIAVSPLASQYAVHYSTKYLTKASQEIPLKGIRHVQTSRGIGSPRAESEYFWRVASFVTARDFQPGDVVYDMNLSREIEADWWNDHDIYPEDE